jgi:hypothetical protein
MSRAIKFGSYTITLRVTGNNAMSLATSDLQTAGNTILSSILAALGGGGATAVNQTNGSQKTQLVDSAGTHTQPAGDAAARPIFTELSDGAAAVGTGANPLRIAPATGTANPGLNLNLSTTNATQLGSEAGTSGRIYITADIANTAPVHIARANTLTTGATGTGIQLQAGDTIEVPGFNSNEYYARTGTATQNVHSLAI